MKPVRPHKFGNFRDILVYQLEQFNEHVLIKTHYRDSFPGWERGKPTWLLDPKLEVAYDDYHTVLDRALDVLEEFGLTEEQY